MEANNNEDKDKKDNHGGGNDHEKTVTLIVNTRSQDWSEKTISYQQVIDLAYPGQPTNPAEEEVTVRYSRGQDDNLEGSLTATHTVNVKNKMVFDVYRTARS
jgi:hypothetical protein